MVMIAKVKFFRFSGFSLIAASTWCFCRILLLSLYVVPFYGLQVLPESPQTIFGFLCCHLELLCGCGSWVAILVCRNLSHPRCGFIIDPAAG